MVTFFTSILPSLITITISTFMVINFFGLFVLLSRASVSLCDHSPIALQIYKIHLKVQIIFQVFSRGEDTFFLSFHAKKMKGRKRIFSPPPSFFFVLFDFRLWIFRFWNYTRTSSRTRSFTPCGTVKVIVTFGYKTHLITEKRHYRPLLTASS